MTIMYFKELYKVGNKLLKNSSLKSTFVIITILLLIIPIVSSNDFHKDLNHLQSYQKKPIESESLTESNQYKTEYKTSLDGLFIYNITSSLSNIIFDVYDEKHGEIAKGRAFGTKGEHRAAEIIYENMTKLGLYNTTLEKLDERQEYTNDNITHKLEVLDYEIRLNNKLVDCYPAPSWKGSHGFQDQLNITFNYTNLKIKPIPKFPFIYDYELVKETENFFFIDKDQWNDPNGVLPIIDIIKPFLDPLKFYMLFHTSSILKIVIQTAMWYKFYPSCKGLILYDFNENCHDMIYFDKSWKNSLPIIFINGSIGRKICENIEDYKIDFYLKQKYNTSVISYNVIGQLNGSDPSKTVIVSSFYDSWWCQGTADSAIGMGIVLAIAKYFQENNITPSYTIKFIAFSGEEYYNRGARYYEASHKNEDIISIIDLNQLGFTQEKPRLTLDIVSNKLSFLNEIWKVAEKTNYVKRTGNVTSIKKIWWINGEIPSNAMTFATNRPNCNAVGFFKDGGWILHHRDGLNHTEGDVLKYYNWTDVNVTGELILNITKYVCIKKDEQIRTNQLNSQKLKEKDTNCNHVKISNLQNLLINHIPMTLFIKTGPRNAIYSSLTKSTAS